MATWTLTGPSFDASSEILRDVRIISTIDRARSKADGYRVRVGAREGEFTSWLGSWDQADNLLYAGISRRVLDDKRIDMRLRDGWKLVVEVKQTGEPADIVGTSVEFVFDKTGSVSGKEKPVITSQPPVGVHDMTEDVATLVNRAKLGERRTSVPLVKETATYSSGDFISIAQYEDEEASADTTTAAAFEDGPVAITVTVPAGKTVHVSVYAHCTHSSDSGRNTLAIGIGDGTTDHNEARSTAGGSGGNEGFVSTRLDTSITATTTFTMRFYRAAGSGTSTTTYNLITATAVAI